MRSARTSSLLLQTLFSQTETELQCKKRKKEKRMGWGGRSEWLWRELTIYQINYLFVSTVRKQLTCVVLTILCLSTTRKHWRATRIFQRKKNRHLDTPPPKKKKKKKLVSGALSPVNHKGLRQGWTQTSLYLQVIHSTSHHTTSYVFWAYLYSVRTQHGNLRPAG